MGDIVDFLVQRTLQGVLVIWGVVTIVFAFRFLSPVNPAELAAPETATQETIQAIERELGLTEPIHLQYLDFMFRVIQGDLGFSYQTRSEVAPQIARALPPTLELAVAGLLFATLVSIPMGVVSARRRGSGMDQASNLVSLGGISTPNFWLAIMLVLVVSVQLNLLPTSSRPIGFLGAIQLLVFQADLGGFISWARHMILPTISLGTYFMALLFRLVRSGVIEELSKEYVSAARAKGMPESLLMYKYVLRNSLIPVITVIGLQLGRLVGGAVVIEAVFNWPGIGTLFIRAIQTVDWPVIQAVMLIVGIGYVVINMSVDVIYTRLNPRVGLS